MEKLYDHSIALIELTKQLEREVCDTMTITNYLGHDYTSNNVMAPEEYEDKVDDDNWRWDKLGGEVVRTVYATNAEITLPIWRWQKFDLYWQNRLTTVYIVDEAGNETQIAEYQSGEGETLKYTFVKDGAYKIKYKSRYVTVQPPRDYPTTLYYSVKTVGNRNKTAPWTITDVVNRILSAGVTRRIGIDAQKYVFDSAQAEKFNKVLAPEFYFTRGTMFEALMTVGGFIHGIPRLVDDNGTLTVRFDLLGQDDKYEKKLPPAIYEDRSLLGNEYCGALDSTVENLLNTTEKSQGAVTEPSANSWRAVNTAEDTFAISADSGLEILTDQPINQVIKVECNYRGKVYDITPYVYENAEYATLSGYEGEAYPYSKGFAVYYVSGQKGISGLTFRLETTSGGTFRNKYAIQNILESLGADTSSVNLAHDLSFRVTYIPIVSSRIVQRKPYLTHPTDNALIYNQGGNAVESEYYGERMRGTLARIGLPTTRRTYEFKYYHNIPKVGQKIGNEYVAVVEREFDRPRIKATITTVPNFNKLAEFLGVNSNYRLYDVSEKQSVDRAVNYGESCVISHESYAPYVDMNERSTMITVDGIAAIQKGLDANVRGTFNKTTAMTMRGKSGRVIGEGGEIVPSIGIAAGSIASGNSLVFYANMLDNYGAGYQSNDVNDDSKRGQRLLPYSDALGNMSTADIAFGSELQGSNAYDYPAGGSIENPYLASYKINEEDSAAAFGISKDSREALKIVFQQHFQADNMNIVVGKALCKYCPLVTTVDDEDKGKLYFLDRQLNPLESVIDLTGISASAQNVNAQNTPNTVCFEVNIPANDSGKTVYSWAIINPSTGELYIGENYSNGLADGEKPASLYFNFLDNAKLAEVIKTIGYTE